MNSFNAIIVNMFVIMSIGIFGGFAGYSSTGDIVSTGKGIEEPAGITGIWDFIGDSVSFLWDMVTFSVADMPAVVSVILYIPVLIIIVCVIRLARGI